MLRKWGIRALITVVAALGIFLVFAVTLQVPAVGRSIGSPQACGTCHVMTREVVTLEKGAHKDLTCLECHSPTGFIDKPVDEIKSASRHLWIFMTNTTPDIIKPLQSSREIVQSRCVQCHASVQGDTHAANFKSGRFCFECHREVPHGTPLRN